MALNPLLAIEAKSKFMGRQSASAPNMGADWLGLEGAGNIPWGSLRGEAWFVEREVTWGQAKLTAWELFQGRC
jgi:hypothetical protein